MAEPLKELTGVVKNGIANIVSPISKLCEISDEKGTLGKNVKDIRDVVCGDDVKSLIDKLGEYVDADTMFKVQMTESFQQSAGMSAGVDKMLKTANTIEKLLINILASVNNIAGATGGKAMKLDKSASEKLKRQFDEAGKQNDKILQMLNIFMKLSSIKESMFVGTKLKLKKLQDVFDSAKEITKDIDNKDLKNINEFVSIAPELASGLLKASIKAMLIPQKGFNKLKSILVGLKGASVLGILRSASTHSKDINRGEKAMRHVLGATAEMALIVTLLTLMAIPTGISYLTLLVLKPTMKLLISILRNVANNSKTVMKAVVPLLLIASSMVLFSIAMLLAVKSMGDPKAAMFGVIALVVMLGLAVGAVAIIGSIMMSGVGAVAIIAGAAAVAIVGVAMVGFGLAMYLATKNIKGMKMDDVKVLGACLGTVALGMAFAGLLSPLIALGSVAMTIAGIAFISLGIGLMLFDKYVTDATIEKVASGIPRIIEAMNGGEKSKPTSFKEGILGLITSALNAGGMILTAGALIFVGVALGLLGLALMAWQNLDAKSAIDNITTAVTGLKECFGLNNDGGSGGLSSVGDGVLGLGLAVLSFGGVLFTMATLLMAVVAMDLIYDGLLPWSSFDTSSVDNLKYAINGLTETFGLNKPGESASLGDVGNSALGLGLAAIQFGSVLFTMASLVIVCAASALIRECLEPWSSFDTKSLNNLDYAIKAIRKTFGMDAPEKKKPKGLFGKLKDMGSKMLEFGSFLMTTGMYLMAGAVMEVIGDALVNFQKTGKSTVDFAMATLNRIKNYFGVQSTSDMLELGWNSERFERGMSRFSRGSKDMLNGIETGAKGFKKVNIFGFALTSMKKYIGLWDDDTSNRARKVGDDIKYIGKSYDKINYRKFKKFAKKTMKLVNTLSARSTYVGIATTNKYFGKVVDNVGRVDMEKVTALTKMFDAFRGINKHGGIFDKFEDNVKLFTEACIDLVNAINGNTEALNAEDEEMGDTVANPDGMPPTGEGNTPQKKSKSVSIENVSELASMIANQIGSMSVDVNQGPIQLYINGSDGNSWTITKQ